ncbi:MAG TPA: family 10 glycosylhydrolase [Paludibacteraceae bacterium]|nr:family 10 glycosylhydrolase [Paludibacteraceae bacterium]HQB69631.1 family 10 glycosylhydrolase [Paludibacteraceae bacterium]
MRKFLSVLITTVMVVSIQAQQPKYQMRAAWIATVARIDWPSSVESVTAQRQELINMLDSLAALKFNVVIFQVRPTSDTFYYSDIEPWSRYLTGKQGVAPEPFYDPLEFLIREAHRRCIDVHVWLNPYRVLRGTDVSHLNPNHLFFKKPELFVKYGDHYYFNPALDETRKHLNRVVADIVTRYDVDAVHFDDYFYPYRIGGLEFPDEDSFRANSRGFTDKADWRRDNVNLVIRQLQQTIKSIKPWVEFGISPFGIWRSSDKDPRGSNTRGMSNYDDLYADVLHWLEAGDIDYVIPQLYWEIGKKTADYAHLVEWWSNNSYGRNLFVGLYASYLGNPSAPWAWRNGNELMRQLRYTEAFPQVQGAAFFSAVALMENRQNLCDSLRAYYKYPALVPFNKHLNGEPSGQLQRVHIVMENKVPHLVWRASEETGGCKAQYYVVYAFKGTKVGDFSNPANILAITTDNCLDLSQWANSLHGKYKFAVTVVNRFNYESKPATVTKRFKK